MAATTEFEVRVLGISPEEIVARLTKAAARYVGDCLMRRYVYDVTPVDQSKWLRLRENGSQTTLCLKQVNSLAVDGTKELEVTVSDFENTHALLGLLGFIAKAYQENRRSSWLLGDVRVEIDTWPMIPPYLEIEGDDVESVYKAADLLGFSRQMLTSDTIPMIYQGYGIDLDAIADLRFRSDNT